jgi:hypothetical protein
MAATYHVERARIPVLGLKHATPSLCVTTAGRNSVTRSQQSYHWTWLGIPVLAGLVFVLALLWLSWWALALLLAGTALGCLWCRAMAIVNGRAPMRDTRRSRPRMVK